MSLLPSRRERRSYPVASFRDEMDRLFDGFFGPGWGLMSADLGDLGRFPAVDVHETDDAVQVKAEVPGMEAKDIDISIVGDRLTIKGEKKEEKEEKDKTTHRIERHYGRFERTVTLPCLTEVDKATAACKDGVLTIDLPKKEEARQKKLKIDVT